MLNYLLSFIFAQGTGNPIPDGLFYYSLTIILAGALIFVIWHYAQKMQNTLEALRITVNELVSITKVHDEKHKQTAEDIAELKKKKR